MESAARALQIFVSGSEHFAIFQDQIAAIAEWRKPAPLPNAPASVLGVVSIQGRMLTVMDPAKLLSADDPSSDELPAKIIALRGDEQLALAADSILETIEFNKLPTRRANGTDSEPALVLETINHKGAQVRILDLSQLFPSAIQGRERRRRRF